METQRGLQIVPEYYSYAKNDEDDEHHHQHHQRFVSEKHSLRSDSM